MIQAPARILVVDDAYKIREHVRLLLEAKGYEVEGGKRRGKCARQGPRATGRHAIHYSYLACEVDHTFQPAATV